MLLCYIGNLFLVIKCFGELAAGLNIFVIGAAGEGACPVTPVEAVVVAQAEVDVARGAIVHITGEVVVAKGIVIDIDIVPTVGIADADFATVNLPRELAVVIVVVAAIHVIVNFVAPASVAIFTLEIHGGAIAVARESVTVVDVGVDISRPGAFEGVVCYLKGSTFIFTLQR